MFASLGGRARHLASTLCLLTCALVRPAAAQSADAEQCVAAHEAAQLARLEARLIAARDDLLRCAQTSCPALVRGDCGSWLGEVERALPSVVFAVDDGQGHDVIAVRIRSSAALIAERADGRALPLDPGIHTLHFEADGHEAHAQVVSIREGEKQRLVHVSLKPLGTPRVEPPPPDLRARRLWRSTYALAGLGVASLGVGTALALRGHAMGPHCDREPPAGEAASCSRAYFDRGQRLYRWADAGFATGGVLLGAAAITLWRALHRQRSEATRSPRLSLDVQRAGMAFALRTSF